MINDMTTSDHLYSAFALRHERSRQVVNIPRLARCNVMKIDQEKFVVILQEEDMQ